MTEPQSIADVVMSMLAPEPAPRTMEQLVNELAESKLEIERLNNLYTATNNSLIAAHRKRTHEVDALKEYLDDNWDNPEAQEIADIFGIETTVYFEATVTVDFTIKGTVPRDKFDEVRSYNFTFSAKADDYSDIEVDEVDTDERGFTVDLA